MAAPQILAKIAPLLLKLKPYIKQALIWAATEFGPDIVEKIRKWGITVINDLDAPWRKYFRSKNVIFLGPSRSGKSALICLLREGHPYTLEKDGKKIPPAKTLAPAVIDKKFKVSKGTWLNVNRDVAGDIELREQWANAIEDLRPKGIVYIVDGSNQTKAEDIYADIERFILPSYKDDSMGLSVLHVLLNYGDKWAHSKHVTRERLRDLKDVIMSNLEKHPTLSNVSVDTHMTQLSMEMPNWIDAERAIHKFGADLIVDPKRQ